MADALTDVSLEVDAGTHVALVGPNGAGKSTILRLLTGVLSPDRGTATVLGRPAQDWKRRDMARQVAVVSQAGETETPLSVRDLVSMGRYPFISPWSPLGPVDQAAVDAILHSVDLADLARCDVRELSGGELQRARLARALVQEPRLLLLDEPTAHLDLGHEARFMELVQQYTVNKAVTVVAVTHHLNVSARFADRMVLVASGRVLKAGSPEDVLTPTLLETAFEWPVQVVDLGPLGRHAFAGTPASGGHER
ncbi:MAG: ABC transporter ATP-binding protein [Gemmatimonadetes bacterium]|nr:ABC transporter ATP-binding protein [Gemmatimonadota bacterium]